LFSRLLSKNVKIAIHRTTILPKVRSGSLTLVEHEIGGFKNRMQRILGPKRRVEKGCGKLHNEQLHILYSSPSIIRMMKSRRMRWAGHVARMGKREMHIGYWWESQRGKYH
jgi:hypothetical protein